MGCLRLRYACWWHHLSCRTTARGRLPGSLRHPPGLPPVAAHACRSPWARAQMPFSIPQLYGVMELRACRPQSQSFVYGPCKLVFPQVGGCRCVAHSFFWVVCFFVCVCVCVLICVRVSFGVYVVGGRPPRRCGGAFAQRAVDKYPSPPPPPFMFMSPPPSLVFICLPFCGH